MAKFNNILNFGAGSLGNTYLRRTRTTSGKTVNVLAQKNFNPRNPRTSTQMVSRAKFATAVKFYKRATRNFFRFAFEDKKKNESDYNAFMRHNIAAAVAMNKGQVDNESYPAVGDRWMLSQGSLSPLLGEWDYDLDGSFSFVHIYDPDESEEFDELEANVKDLSSILVRYLGYKVGQIFTLVVVTSDNFEVSNVGGLSSVPRWNISQFVINQDDTTLLSDVKHIGSNYFKIFNWGRNGDYFWCGLDFNEDNALSASYNAPCWCAAIITDRQSVPGKLLATTTYLEGNDIAKQLIASMRTDGYHNSMLNSWRADLNKAILQGSIADKI